MSGDLVTTEWSSSFLPPALEVISVQRNLLLGDIFAERRNILLNGLFIATAGVSSKVSKVQA